MRNLHLMVVCTLLVSLLLTGCVKKSVYQQTVDQLNSTLSERDTLITQLETCKAERASAQSDLERCQATLSQSGQEVTSLKAQGETLAKDLEATQRAVDEMALRAQQQEERLKTYRQLMDRFRKLIQGGQLEVQVVRGRMVVKLGEGVLFASGSATLTPSGEAVLTEVTRVLKDLPSRSFQIEGHTDNVPLRNSTQFPSNWELSAARAISVVTFMIGQGMDPTRLSAAGFGEFKPQVPNDTPEQRAQNRRIEIVLMPNLEELPSFEELQRIQ